MCKVICVYMCICICVYMYICMILYIQYNVTFIHNSIETYAYTFINT